MAKSGKNLGRRVTMLASMADSKKKHGKNAKDAQHPNIEPIHTKPLEKLQKGAKADPPKKKKKDGPKKPNKNKKVNTPNPY